MSVAIKIENLSKQYRLGLVSTRTLSHDLNRWWTMNILGKDDPYLKIGEGAKEQGSQGAREPRSEGKRFFASSYLGTENDCNYIWALKDINLEVHQGEVLGIIGKNGAGKSTLLKILSKVTAPTTGTIKANGHIASLLEVGTGFHPEMTGRENIFMNGAIMGMSKADITRRFDEIVDFAGIEKFIDTPVKRYSSGMTVRLGFAVAAHLEPEILVVDEVLAVGDAEFQKKAIGKMQDITKGEGRIVLFVSHNLGAVRDLCKKTLILNDGILSAYGNTQQIIEKYLSSNNKSDYKFKRKNITISEVKIYPQPVISNRPISFYLKIHTNETELINSIGLLIYNQYEQRVAIIDLRDESFNYSLRSNQELCFYGKIEQLPLVEGIYKIGLFYGGNFISENILNLIEISVLNDNNKLVKYPAEVRGYVNLNYEFSFEII